MKIDWQNYSIARSAADNGCTAKTAPGVARWVRKNGGKMPRPMTPAWLRFECGAHASYRARRLADYDLNARRWTEHRLADDALAAQADEAARNLYRNRRNWRSAIPATVRPKQDAFNVITHDEGRYSSRCTYTKYEYTPTYQSSVRVWRSGKTAEVWKLNKMARRILAPAGLRFAIDNLGAHVVAADGTDYHPTAAEWQSPKFAAVVRAALTAKRKAVRQAAIAARESDRVAKIRDRQMASCRVTLADSRRAGNCVEGSLVFAERRLGMSRAEIVAGGHLVHVSGAALLATGDARARKAVEVAWLRETTVCI